MMVNAERNNGFYSNLHGFEDQENIATKINNNSQNLSSSCDTDIEMKNQCLEYSPECDANNYVEKDFVIIERFYRQNSRDNTPLGSCGKENNGSDYFAGLCDEKINEEIAIKEIEREKEEEERRISVERFFTKRNDFLVKIEDYIRKTLLSKSPKSKSTTKIITTEKIDYITKRKTTTTVTEKIITETIPIMFYITVSDYVDKLPIDLISFPATKVRKKSLLFCN